MLFLPSFLHLFKVTLSVLIKRVAVSWVMIWETVTAKMAPTRKILLTNGDKDFYETLADNRKKTSAQSCPEDP